MVIHFSTCCGIQLQMKKNVFKISPNVVSCPSNGGEEQRASVSKYLSMKPRFTEKGVTDHMDVHLAQKLGHVFRIEGKVKVGSESECKERISQCSQGTLSNCCWAKKLIKELLLGFVRVLATLAKVVGET